MKIIKGLLLSILAALPAIAMSDEEAAAAGVMTAMGIGFLFLIIYIAIVIFFVKAQNRLIDTLEVNNKYIKTGKVWTWTQLIPLWSYVATGVSIAKITNQFDTYVQEKNIQINPSNQYKPVWGWLFLGFSVAGMIIPLVGFVALAFFIIYWININSVVKSIKNVNSSL
jgi:heme/copper-type cytochrome/quinol oxidase subunit 2